MLVMTAGEVLPGARQHQQLLNGVHQLIDAGDQRLAAFDALFLHQFQMQANAGQRRAQLVGRVGGEQAFLLDGVVQPREQLIERIGDRHHFQAVAVDWQRRQVIGRALFQPLLQLVERAGDPADGPE